MTELGLDYPTKWGRRYSTRFVRHLFLHYIVRPYLRWVAVVTVDGIDNLVSQRPLIFVANHSSHIDTALVLTALPQRIRNRTVVAAAMDSFFMDRATAFRTVFMFNAIPVDRHKVNRRSAQLALELVQDHWNLLIYPEGGRTPDGQLQEFKGGAAYLAERANAVVIPTYIHDSGYVKSARWAKAPLYVEGPEQRRPNVSVTFGAPLTCQESESVRRFGARIEEAVIQLGQSVSGDATYGIARNN